jgi:DNA-binding NtrC family response regulator
VRGPEPLILVVDDEELIQVWMSERLRASGYAVATASTGAEATIKLKELNPDLMLLDLRLPDGNGIQLLEGFREIDRELVVIMVTAYGEIQAAVEAVKAGAYDFIEKPVEFDSLLLNIEKGLEKRRLRQEVAFHREQHRWRFANIDLVARSPVMGTILQTVRKVAQAESATVLISGESGTGKDLVARAIHAWSPRADRPFLEINCSALPDSLVESELFGHERGAFTDARARKLGLAELADGGTLFLDEVGDMPTNTQPKVLRFLEDSRFKRVGGTIDVRVDVRLIAATNHDLEEMVHSGDFRSDLYFRLRVVPIHIPPLRERPEDIEPLALLFLEQLSRDLRRDPVNLSDAALQVLEAYRWPGNVRELKNLLERVLILEHAREIHLDHLPLEVRQPRDGLSEVGGVRHASPEGLRLVDAEKDLIRRALLRTQGNVTRAASLLGISRDTLRYRLTKFPDLADPGRQEIDST